MLHCDLKEKQELLRFSPSWTRAEASLSNFSSRVSSFLHNAEEKEKRFELFFFLYLDFIKLIEVAMRSSGVKSHPEKNARKK